MSNYLKSSPIALYIHIPWCVSKCPYCDFNSHQLKPSQSYSAYIDCLCTDLKLQLQELSNRYLSSIFIGGGTPSLCPDSEINRLLNFCRDLIPWQDDIEVTIEANPGTVDEQFFAGYLKSGINRLSIGAQSFNNTSLKKLGRIHESQSIYNSVGIAKNCGFKRINLDIMYALPSQSLEMAKFDLEQVISCDVEHISYYQLTLEPNTPFFKKPPQQLPSDRGIQKIELEAQKIFNRINFENYEISAWAKKSENVTQCQHNLNYWNFGDYIGIGAGAHGKITQLINEKRVVYRTYHSNAPNAYIKTANVKKTIITDEKIMFEYMLNRLRLTKSISLNDCVNKTNNSVKVVQHYLSKAVDKGFLEQKQNENDYLFTKTHLGQQFLDDLQQIFLP